MPTHQHGPHTITRPTYTPTLALLPLAQVRVGGLLLLLLRRAEGERGGGGQESERGGNLHCWVVSACLAWDCGLVDGG